MEPGKLLGLALATSAAALFLSGCASAPAGGDAQSSDAKVNCEGANGCKGLSECHTAKNQCAGQNACRGQGWLSLTAEECKKATGT
jgi:hypothetical protein